MTKALVVDDNINDRILLSKILITHGYEVVEAGNGVEALEQVEIGTPDIIVSDIMMPEMDGFMLLQILKNNSNTKSIPFVFYTASYMSNEDRQLGLSLGASRFLIKPEETAELIGQINGVLEEFDACKIKPDDIAIADDEYLKKYSERIFLKLESKIKKLEEEIQRHKETEKKLQQSEEKFRDFYEEAPNIYYSVGIDGRILKANRQAVEMLGFSLSELIGKNVFDLYADTPFGKEKAKEIFKKFLAGVEIRGEELEMQRKDGSNVWMTLSTRPLRDDEGNVIACRSIAVDITKRIKTEEALKDSEERYRRLVELSPYGIAIHSEGKIVYINLAGAKILGTDNPDELVGKILLRFIHPDYHEIVKDRIRMQGEGKVAPPLEEKFLRLDGSPVDIEIASIPFKYMGKQAMYGVFRDITERKKAEETRLENLRLVTADKAKSEFFANMSHELRTPLNASIGFSELLELDGVGKLNEKQKEYVDIIHKSNQFLLTLINDILDLSKIESGKIELIIEKIPVPKTIGETLTLIKEKAMKHKVLLETEIDPELEFIEADKQRFKQVLFNLLSNAIKFSKDEGGTVTITTKKEGDMAQISVSDTGIGIKEENIDKLFHKFEQLEFGISQKYGGTGLGLAITKQLVELHGGQIWANSKYGKGSAFIFTLPLEAKKEMSY